MTTYAVGSVVCGACQRVFSQDVLTSTNVNGSPDLDMRPPEMRRSTMRTWVERCPSCGYCADDASEFDERYRPVMEGAAYRSQLADPAYPELASTFICCALLAEAVGQRADAAWSYLHAAWVLDDADCDSLARVWRGRAAETIVALLKSGEIFLQQPGASEAIATDCFRRAGRGAEALALVESASQQSFEDVIQQVLAFQRALIERGDTARHLMREAIGDA